MKKPETFLYQEIAESIRMRIASGELQPGDRLPSVRESARQWGCTPGTVNRAYSTLAQEGLLVGHRGGGTRVARSSLQLESPTWQWLTLINQAEQFLLEAISSGYTPIQAESALSVAVSRLRELERKGIPSSRPEPSVKTAGLRFAGSHDLTVEFMTRMLGEAAPEAQLSVEYVGSLGGLMALAQNQADVAGTHLWDEATDTYNIPFIQRVLPGRRVALLTLVHRSLGLITPRGNPHGLKSLVDLARTHVRLVNRQSGSGTRVWLDAQLKALEIAPESISGFEREELTHLAVARAVDQGEATVGLGIYAAAAACGLGFVPLTQERYDLVISENVRDSMQVMALIALIRSDRFKEAVTTLGGYETSETGQERWIS